MLVLEEKDDIFFQYFVEKHFLKILMGRLIYFRFSSGLLKTVFSTLEYLLKVLKKEEHLIYFIISVNR